MSDAAGVPVPVVLDGDSLDLASFVAVARGGARVVVGDWAKLEAARTWLDQRLDEWRAGQSVAPMYGITTGFGSSKNVVLGAKDLEAAQVNLIRSHAFGIAEGPEDLFSEDESHRPAFVPAAAAFLIIAAAVVTALVFITVHVFQSRVEYSSIFKFSGKVDCYGVPFFC